MMRILIVDDDPRVLSVTQRWLLSAGYSVLTSNEFHDAETEIRIDVPDVLLLDVRLGEFNGMQLGILARQARSDARVVMMSSWDDAVLRREAARFGAAFINKPFRAPQLLDAIEGHI